MISVIEFKLLRPFLLDYVRSVTGEEGKQTGRWIMFHSPLREDKNRSFGVNIETNNYNDLGISDARGKGDIIKLFSLVDKETRDFAYTEAARKLSYIYLNPNSPNYKPAQLAKPTSTENQPHTSTKILNQTFHPLKSRKLISYGLSRGVRADILTRFCELCVTEYYNGGKSYNIAFKNDKGGYDLRGSDTTERKGYKGSALNSAKAITTLKSTSQTKTVLVFEGFFDALSYMSLPAAPAPFSTTAPADYIVLNSIVNIAQAIKALAKYDTIRLYLDNDNGGKETTAKIREHYPFAEDHAPRFAPSKDVNEYILQRRQQETHRPANGSTTDPAAGDQQENHPPPPPPAP